MPWRSWVQANPLVGIGDRPVEFAFVIPRTSAIDVGRGKARIEPYRLAEIGDSAVMLFPVAKGAAAQVESFRAMRIEADRLRRVGERVFAVVFAQVGPSAMDVHLNPCRCRRASIRDDLRARKDAAVGLALLAVVEIVSAGGRRESCQKRQGNEQRQQASMAVSKRALLRGKQIRPMAALKQCKSW